MLLASAPTGSLLAAAIILGASVGGCAVTTDDPHVPGQAGAGQVTSDSTPAPVSSMATATSQPVLEPGGVIAEQDCVRAVRTDTGTDGVAIIDGFAINLREEKPRGERRTRIAAAGPRWEDRAEQAELVPVVYEVESCHAAGTVMLRRGVAYVKSWNPDGSADPLTIASAEDVGWAFVLSKQLSLADLAQLAPVQDMLRTAGMSDPEGTLMIASRYLDGTSRRSVEDRRDVMRLAIDETRDGVTLADLEKSLQAAASGRPTSEARGREPGMLAIEDPTPAAEREAIRLAIGALDRLLEAEAGSIDEEPAEADPRAAGGAGGGIRTTRTDDDPIGDEDEVTIGRILRRILYPIIVGEDTGTAAPGTEVILAAEESRGGEFLRVEHHLFLHTDSKPAVEEGTPEEGTAADSKTSVFGWIADGDEDKRTLREWCLGPGELITLHFVEAPGDPVGNRRRLNVKAASEPISLKHLERDDSRWCTIVAALRLGYRRLGAEVRGITVDVLGPELFDVVTSPTLPPCCHPEVAPDHRDGR